MLMLVSTGVMAAAAQDLLEDIRNTNTIKYVMKNGELFEGDTLNQIWPKQKTPPRLWWWDEQQ